MRGLDQDRMFLLQIFRVPNTGDKRERKCAPCEREAGDLVGDIDISAIIQINITLPP